MAQRRTVKFTDNGITYEAAVERRDGEPHLARLTITPDGDADLQGAVLLPLELVTFRALAAVEAADGKPSPEVLGAAYSHVLRAQQNRRPIPPRVSVRRELAAAFGVPQFTIDRWIAAVRRDHPDLIPEPTTGQHTSKIGSTREGDDA